MEANNRQIKFEELATKRVNESLKRIRLIGNLANKSNYRYTKEHVNQIIKALEDEIKILKNKYQDNETLYAPFKFNINN